MAAGKWLIPAVFGFLGITAVVLVVVTLAGGQSAPPGWFTATWLGILTLNAWGWFWWISLELTLEDRDLIWSCILRTGRVGLDDLTEIRPMRLASNVAVFKVSGGRSIIIMAGKGIREFTNEISKVRPDLPVRLGWQARVVERMPGRSNTTRR
ncbi:MAG: hypothetical protein OSA99_04110 [Acidimicrobiales bacterium]|nr:hypothetical protein [Acidimicrobiales bacterium]